MEELNKQIAALKEKRELAETITGEGDNISLDIMHNNDDGETVYVKLGPGNESDIIESLNKHFSRYVETLVIPNDPGGENNPKSKGRGRVS